MGSEQTLMHAEAAEAAVVAERQAMGLEQDMARLGRRLRDLDPPLVITCARGSSDHAATYAKYLIETRARTPVASFAPSTASLYGTPWRHLLGTLFIAISQSGRSPDILISAQSARDAGALVVAIVNDADSPLAHIAEVTIPMLAGPERGVAATKSFIATLLAILNLVAVWTDQEDLRLACSAAPPALREAWKLDWSAAVDTLTGANSLFVIGRGLTFGIAQEAALKLKETCGLHAEAYSAAEVRHGPMALVGPGFPLLMFTPIDESGKDFGALAQELVDLGARIIMTGEEAQDAVPVPLPPGLHPALVPIAAVQSFYRFAASLSLARGLDPDRPPHLRKVTRTR